VLGAITPGGGPAVCVTFELSTKPKSERTVETAVPGPAEASELVQHHGERHASARRQPSLWRKITRSFLGDNLQGCCRAESTSARQAETSMKRLIITTAMLLALCACSVASPEQPEQPDANGITKSQAIKAITEAHAACGRAMFSWIGDDSPDHWVGMKHDPANKTLTFLGDGMRSGNSAFARIHFVCTYNYAQQRLEQPLGPLGYGPLTRADWARFGIERTTVDVSTPK
jgi:hypothetical protein